MTIPDTDAPPLRFLRELTDTYAPTVRGRAPLWYWQPPRIWSDVHVPAWSWKRADYQRWPASELVTLDANGAYLGVLGSVWLPLSGLQHTPGARFDKNVPGWWLVDVHRWEDTRIVSPLGTKPIRGRKVWLTTPTMELLQQLNLDGRWPDLTVHDAWTAWITRDLISGQTQTTVEKCRLEAWQARLRSEREDALLSGDRDRQAAVKDAYGAAINLLAGMQEGEKRKSRIRRPDMHTHIVSAFAAAQWRKAFGAVTVGADVVRMHETDTLTVPLASMELLLQVAEESPRPPIRFDLTGRKLGHFKIKHQQGDR